MQGIYTYIPETNYVPKEYSIIIIIIIITIIIIIIINSRKLIQMEHVEGTEEVRIQQIIFVVKPVGKNHPSRPKGR